MRYGRVRSINCDVNIITGFKSLTRLTERGERGGELLFTIIYYSIFYTADTIPVFNSVIN